LETRIDWRQVWNDNLDAHRRKLPASGSPADQNNVEVQSNINRDEVVKQSKQCNDRRTSSRTVTYAVGHPQRRMLVYYDRYDQFQQVPCADFPRKGLTGAKFGVKIWNWIGGSCLSLLQIKTMSNINEEKQVLKV
jgi:hypothetical protein